MENPKETEKKDILQVEPSPILTPPVEQENQSHH